MPELDRHAVSQARSLKDFAARLQVPTRSDREKEISHQRDISRLFEYQLAKDLFEAQHYALWDAFGQLHDFIRRNGLKGDSKEGGLSQQVPIADGNGGFTRMFKHNLNLALRLLLTVKHEHDQMEAYKRSLPDHAWVVQFAFGQCRTVYAELAQERLLFTYTPPTDC